MYNIEKTERTYAMNKNQLNPRSLYLSKYNSSRYSLLMMLAFTAVNIIIAICGDLTYFLFSATIPYTLVIEGVYLTGGLADEYYADLPVGYEFFDKSLLIVMVVIAAVIIGVYLLCFFMSSKKRVGWLIAATVIFSLDTLFLLGYYGFSSFVDIIMHGLMIYYLINGIVNGFKLKKLPEEDEVPEDYVPEVPYVATEEVPAPTVPEETPATEKTEEVPEESKPSEDTANE